MVSNCDFQKKKIIVLLLKLLTALEICQCG